MPDLGKAIVFLLWTTGIGAVALAAWLIYAVIFLIGRFF